MGSILLTREGYWISSVDLMPVPRSVNHFLWFCPRDPVGQQPAHDARPLLVDRDEVLDALLEVARVGVDAAEHDLVAEHEALVDQIDRLGVHRVAAGDRQQAEHAVGPEDLHRVEDDARDAGRLDDDVGKAGFLRHVGQRLVGDAHVLGAEPP